METDVDSLMDICDKHATEMVSSVIDMPISKQDKLGMLVVMAGVVMGGAGALANAIAIERGGEEKSLHDICEVVAKLILNHLKTVN